MNFLFPKNVIFLDRNGYRNVNQLTGSHSGIEGQLVLTDKELPIILLYSICIHSTDLSTKS